MPTVSREVIKDLMPIYIAGEASADTRALVEEHLARDPELQQFAASARQAEEAMGSSASIPEAKVDAMEVASLERTRSLLRRRSWLFGLSLWFTLLPFTLIVRHGELKFLLLRDQPLLGTLSIAAAATGWLLYLRTLRKLNHTGFGRR